MQDRILALLGLAAKSGRLLTGSFSAQEAVKSRKAKLVLMAEDAQTNTVKTFTDKCGYYKVPIRFYGTKETLGRAVGKDLRACVAVLDRGFADSILKLTDSSGKGGGCVRDEDQRSR